MPANCVWGGLLLLYCWRLQIQKFQVQIVNEMKRTNSTRSQVNVHLTQRVETLRKLFTTKDVKVENVTGWEKAHSELLTLQESNVSAAASPVLQQLTGLHTCLFDDDQGLWRTVDGRRRPQRLATGERRACVCSLRCMHAAAWPLALLSVHQHLHGSLMPWLLHCCTNTGLPSDGAQLGADAGELPPAVQLLAHQPEAGGSALKAMLVRDG